MKNTNPATDPVSPLTDRDELFARVDGQVFEGTDREWRVEIVGIHGDEDSYWVQLLAVAGSDHHGATIRVDRSAARALLKQIRNWVKQLPEADPQSDR